MTDFTIPRHTPGPWHVYNVQTDPFARIGTYKHAICTMAPSGNVYADAANARLIAAAPEMLAILRDILAVDQGGDLTARIAAVIAKTERDNGNA